MKYEINNDCVSCGTCQAVCPVNAIIPKIGSPYLINQKCIGCGKCAEVCPIDAIFKKDQ